MASNQPHTKRDAGGQPAEKHDGSRGGDGGKAEGAKRPPQQEPQGDAAKSSQSPGPK